MVLFPVPLSPDSAVIGDWTVRIRSLTPRNPRISNDWSTGPKFAYRWVTANFPFNLRKLSS